MLRIHDILGWIRIRGFKPLTNGSGFGSGSRSWIRILLFLSLTFKMPAKNKIFNTIFSAYDFLKLHLHHFSKKESQNRRNQGFSYYFCMMIEGSGLGCPRNEKKRFSVRTETNRNKICFAFVSVGFVKPKIFFFRFVSVFRTFIETTKTNRTVSNRTETIRNFLKNN